MIFGYKSPSSIVAEIKMTRMLKPGSFLIVEGKSDERFWLTRKSSTCEIIDGEGKPNVIGAIRKLDVEPISGVLGIVDDDYDSLTGNKLYPRNLISTDTHDLECLLCRSKALDTTLAQYGDIDRISAFINKENKDVRSALLDRAYIFGLLRWTVIHNGLDINMNDKINIARFVDESTWAVDKKGQIQEIIRDHPSYDENTLNSLVCAMPKRDPWRVAHGKDMVQILRIGMKNVLGDISSRVKAEDISKILQASIFLPELKSTKFGQDIVNWEVENTGYPIFVR